MSAQNNGGPAFPHAEKIVNEYHKDYGRDTGMSLRDYFAAKAMQGMLTRPGSINPKQDAEFAYLISDAMLKAREATK